MVKYTIGARARESTKQLNLRHPKLNTIKLIQTSQFNNKNIYEHFENFISGVSFPRDYTLPYQSRLGWAKFSASDYYFCSQERKSTWEMP